MLCCDDANALVVPANELVFTISQYKTRRRNLLFQSCYNFKKQILIKELD